MAYGRGSLQVWVSNDVIELWNNTSSLSFVPTLHFSSQNDTI